MLKTRVDIQLQKNAGAKPATPRTPPCPSNPPHLTPPLHLLVCYNYRYRSIETGRFVNVVARVQNTTGPDCFSLKVDSGIGTAPHPCLSARPPAALRAPYPSTGFAPGFTPWDGTDRAARSDGSGGGVAPAAEVGFVRSQLDGSFALF